MLCYATLKACRVPSSRGAGRKAGKSGNVEAEGAQVAQRGDMPAVVERLDGVRTVFSNAQSVASRQFENGGHIASPTSA
jgi:hypothetical protein